MMLIASIENAGSLLGIGALYPVYERSIKEDLQFLSGGRPYYMSGVSLDLQDRCISYVLIVKTIYSIPSLLILSGSLSRTDK